MHPLRPALNYDILHMVMSLSSKREVCSMMGTCKFLHWAGAEFLLHDVTLRDEHDIRSFTQFMAADPYHRIRYLGIVTFECGRLSRDVALLLRIFLEFSAPFLGLLHLRLLNSEDMLSSDPELINTFSRIAFIAMLSVRQPGILSFDLLSRISGTVQMAVLVCTQSGAEPPEDSNPILALRSLCNTLVQVTGFGVRANIQPDRCAGIVFPHVRKLRLETSVPIHSAEYARAYPNLASLHLACRTLSLGDFDEDERDELAVHRERNRTLLRERGGWSRLEFLDGTPVDLWALGLHSTVERLKLFIAPMNETCQVLVAGIFEELMRDIRVKRIHLDIWMSRAAGDALRTLSRTSRDLEHLGLHAVFDPEEPMADITGMLDALVAYVGVGSLQSLHVDFSCMDLLLLSREDDIDIPSASVDECKQLFHPDALAARIQSRASSIRDISLELWIENQKIGTFHKGEEIPNPAHWEY